MKTATQNITDYRAFLTATYEARRKRNPQYSLRAFAGAIGISVAQLSKILNRRQALSARHATRIADRLALSPRQRRQLLGSLTSDLAGANATLSPALAARELLSEDRFRLIADWWHFAILSLGYVDGNRADPQWIATRLGIPERTARDAWERLERLGVVERLGDGFRQRGVPLKTSEDIPSEANRRFHRQTLELAIDRLENVPIELKEFTAVTLPLNPERLPEAKAVLRDCKRQLIDLLMNDDGKSAVYTLSMLLFPLSQENPR